MLRLRVSVPVLTALLLACGWVLAQEAKKGDDKEPVVIKRPNLPVNYKKLGLSTDQVKSIYKIRGTYAAKIEALQQQISDLREQEKAELDKVLTDAQRARLKELRAGSPAPKDVKAEEAKKESR